MTTCWKPPVLFAPLRTPLTLTESSKVGGAGGWGRAGEAGQKIHSLLQDPMGSFGIEINLSLSTKEAGNWVIIIVIITHSTAKKSK